MLSHPWLCNFDDDLSFTLYTILLSWQVKILRTKEGGAMVNMQDPDSCRRAMMNLNRSFFYGELQLSIWILVGWSLGFENFNARASLSSAYQSSYWHCLARVTLHLASVTLQFILACAEKSHLSNVLCKQGHCCRCANLISVWCWYWVGVFVGQELSVTYSKQEFVKIHPNPNDLDDGTPSAKDYANNKNNRFFRPDSIGKTRFSPPTKVLDDISIP